MDRNDADYLRCRRLLTESVERLIVPAPVLVEVDYLVRQRLHSGVMLRLLDSILDGGILIEPLQAVDYERIRGLIERYADSDIGFVDAAVLAVVERLGEPKLATLDRRHFGLLRPRHVDALQLLPD